VLLVIFLELLFLLTNSSICESRSRRESRTSSMEGFSSVDSAIRSLKEYISLFTSVDFFPNDNS